MTNLKLITVASLATMVSVAAFAHGGEKMSFADIDANSDGQITQAEFKAQGEARFAEADADGNGELSMDEMIAMRAMKKGGKDVDEIKEKHKERFERIFAAMDKDGSGGLSSAELPFQDREAMIIAKLDSNGDGSISEEEFDEMKGRFGGKRGKW